MRHHLFLTGNMGAGKSTVGALLAHLLGWHFCDLDTEIEQMTQKTIPQLFQERGEPYFRTLESQILQQRSATSVPTVFATGGGIVLSEANRARMFERGWVVHLFAPPEELARRVGKAGNRPLLQGHSNLQERLAKIATEREPFYQEADWIVDTTHQAPEQIAQQIARLVMPTPTHPLCLPVLEGTERAYEVRIAPGICHTLAEHLLPLKCPSAVALLTHPTLLPWTEPIVQSLEQHAIRATVITLPSGERMKTLRTAERLYKALLQAGIDREGILVVVGGGMLGDLGGFVSATYLRGIPFVQVPTSLLAQVDSSVGGKVGVDLPEGKNLVGAFHQPLLVLIDPEMLSTLPLRQARNGFAEVIKYGITLDKGLWQRLTLMVQQRLISPRRFQPDPAEWTLPIAKCIHLKARIVSTDERDTQGTRALLNFGHTVGHAIEAVMGYRNILHGEAVAIGMRVEAHIGRLMGITPPEVVTSLEAMLQQVGLPTELPALELDEVLGAMRYDKKSVHGELRMVLLEAIGRAQLVPKIPVETVQEALRLCASHSL